MLVSFENNVCTFVVFLICCLAIEVLCHENLNPLVGKETDPDHHHEQPKGTQHQQQHHFGSSAEHNREHIQEHLDGVIKTGEDNMTEDELQFHYFKLHDYNNDNMLDGCEILKAILHEQREHEGQGHEPEQSTKPVNVDPMARTVDNVLKQHDHNGDGYISYPEYKLGDRRSS